MPTSLDPRNLKDLGEAAKPLAQRTQTDTLIRGGEKTHFRLKILTLIPNAGLLSVRGENSNPQSSRCRVEFHSYREEG